MRCGLIDVFTNAPLGGNPLAIVEGGDGQSSEVMAKLAREFNQSETTFILTSTLGADFALRSFTAAGFEVAGVGHNALGAWLWLALTGRLGALDRPASLTQEIGGRLLELTVEKRDGRPYVFMKQGPLEVGGQIDRLGLVATALGLAEDVLLAPAITASTGTMHLFVEALDARTIDRARPDADRLLPILKEAQAQGLYLYARDDRGAFKSRFFNPTAGLWEDPATGSAAGPLVAIECRRGRVADEDTVLIRQGESLGRPSDILVRAGDPVVLCGTGVIVLDGELRLQF